MNNNEIGKDGELRASQYLIDSGFEIVDLSNQHLSPYDILARKNDVLYAINVKTTIKRDSIAIQLSNIPRLLNFCLETNSIMSYLLLSGNNYLLVVLDKALLHWDVPARIVNRRSIVTSFSMNPPSIRAINGSDWSIPIPDAMWSAVCGVGESIQVNITRIDDDKIKHSERTKPLTSDLIIKR